MQSNFIHQAFLFILLRTRELCNINDCQYSSLLQESILPPCNLNYINYCVISYILSQKDTSKEDSLNWTAYLMNLSLGNHSQLLFLIWMPRKEQNMLWHCYRLEHSNAILTRVVFKMTDSRNIDLS